MQDYRNDVPISEQYRVAALAWVEADSAASLMEETKSTVFAQMVVKLIEAGPKMAVNRAELIAKASDEWSEFINTMVQLRAAANRLRIPMDVLRMQAMEQQSQEATKRTEMRL